MIFVLLLLEFGVGIVFKYSKSASNTTQCSEAPYLCSTVRDVESTLSRIGGLGHVFEMEDGDVLTYKEITGDGNDADYSKLSFSCDSSSSPPHPP
jgi:hypothetical protein